MILNRNTLKVVQLMMEKSLIKFLNKLKIREFLIVGGFYRCIFWGEEWGEGLRFAHDRFSGLHLKSKYRLTAIATKGKRTATKSDVSLKNKLKFLKFTISIVFSTLLSNFKLINISMTVTITGGWMDVSNLFDEDENFKWTELFKKSEFEDLW